MIKDVKYNVGDVVFYTVLNCKVILLSRWDKKPFQRTAWLCREYPDGLEEFAAAEIDLEDTSSL